MTQSESSKKGKTKGRKKKTETKSEDGQLESITCNECKRVFTSEDSKLVCCDRCEIWYCTKCVNISDEGYSFLSSREAENIAWYCKACKEPAKLAVIEDKSIEDKCNKYLEEIKKSIETLGESLQRKVDKEEFEGLKNKIDEIEKEIEILKKDAQEEGSWTNINTAAEKRKIEEVIDISLKDYENEERERQNRRKNIIVFGLPESEKTIPEERKEDDVKKMIGLCKNICKIKFNETDISRIIRLGKAAEDKERPLLITINEEIKKKEIFRNLNKIRDAGSPFNKVTITHDMTKKQKEELKIKMETAKEMEQKDNPDEYMYRVRGPPWNWYIKRIQKKMQ